LNIVPSFHLPIFSIFPHAFIIDVLVNLILLVSTNRPAHDGTSDCATPYGFAATTDNGTDHGAPGTAHRRTTKCAGGVACRTICAGGAFGLRRRLSRHNHGVTRGQSRNRNQNVFQSSPGHYFSPLFSLALAISG
jgi:hypothetical protein